MNKHTRCTNCDTCYKDTPAQHTGWFNLQAYYGLLGNFCPKCFSLVEHDNLFHKPKHPRHFAAILFKQQVLAQHEKDAS